MKHALFALTLVAAWAATGTSAKAQEHPQDYPWCANYTKGHELQLRHLRAMQRDCDRRSVARMVERFG